MVKGHFNEAVSTQLYLRSQVVSTVWSGQFLINTRPLRCWFDPHPYTCYYCRRIFYSVKNDNSTCPLTGKSLWEEIDFDNRDQAEYLL